MKKFSIFVLLFSTVLLPAHSFAYQQGEQAEAQSLERIEVLGERPVSYYKKQLKNAQRAFFDEYNNFAGEDDFKIECEFRKKSFSNYQTQECEPKFVSKLLFEGTQEAFSMGSRRDVEDMLARIPSKRKMELVIAQRRKQQLEDMAQQIQAHPSLLAAYQKMVFAKSSLEQAKESQQ